MRAFVSIGPLSSRVAFSEDIHGEDEELKSFSFPKFGLSPGPTPSPSTPSATTPSDFDVSEVHNVLYLGVITIVGYVIHWWQS